MTKWRNMMPSGISASHLKLVAVVSGVYAALSAFLWLWTLVVALGLGFKDKSTWSVFDHFQATVIPMLALVFATPGRFAFSEGWIRIIIPWIANSVLWGAGTVFVFALLRHKR